MTNAYENKLDKFWQNQDIIYIYFHAHLEGIGSCSEVWSLICYYNSIISICIVRVLTSEPDIAALACCCEIHLCLL